VQRTLAGELQRLSVTFRKQQKQHLNQLRQRDGGAGASFLADGGAASAALADDDYDPGFTDVQVRPACLSIPVVAIAGRGVKLLNGGHVSEHSLCILAWQAFPSAPSG